MKESIHRIEPVKVLTVCTEKLYLVVDLWQLNNVIFAVIKVASNTSLCLHVAPCIHCVDNVDVLCVCLNKVNPICEQNIQHTVAEWELENQSTIPLGSKN